MHVCVVGPGRAGSAFHARLVERGVDASVVRDVAFADTADAVLLAVPDRAIAACASALPAVRWLGMLSGATPLDALGAGRPGRFVLHPLMTIVPGGDPAQLDGAPVTVTGGDPAATAFALDLAARLGLRGVVLDAAARPLPHAACVLASNALAAPLAAACKLLAAAGLDPGDAPVLLGPLAHRAVDHALAAGGSATAVQAAVTGPIARGDAVTIAAHLAALAEHAPETLALYRALGRLTLPLVDPAAAAAVAPLLAEPEAIAA